MPGSNGVSGSDVAFQTLIGHIGDQATQADNLTTQIGTNTKAWAVNFGDFTEAQELYNAFYDTCLRIYQGVGVLHNALQDLHDGTVDIRKNYSDANDNTEYSAQKLKSYDDYLDKYAGQTTGSA